MELLLGSRETGAVSSANSPHLIEQTAAELSQYSPHPLAVIKFNITKHV